MSEYRRVLISIDPADAHQPMAPALRRLVDTNHAEITLLHVVESQPWIGRARHSLRLLTELDILAHRRFRGARLIRRIEWGRPADCILNVLRTDRLDAVLLTAGGASLSRDPLGPVAAEVIAEAPCPVLLEWPASHPVNQARVRPVCCAVELDGSEERVLREAAWAAERCAEPLILLCSAGDAALVEDLRDRYAPGATISTGVSPATSMVCIGGESGTLSCSGHVSGGRNLGSSWPRANRKSRLKGSLQPGMDAPQRAMFSAGCVRHGVFEGALRFHGAGLLVAGGSRDALLAAEGECPVLYVGPARSLSRNQHAFAGRRYA